MPRGANLQKLAEVLGVSIAYLSNDEIVDPAYGLEESPYIESARAVYGKRGAADVEQLLTQTRALFAGGDVPEEDRTYLLPGSHRGLFCQQAACQREVHPQGL